MLYHQFADDTQLFIAVNAGDATQALDHLAAWSSAAWQRFLQNSLQLNTTTSLRASSSAQRTSFVQLPASRQLIEVAGSKLNVVDHLKSLGVMINAHFRFDCHVNNVARACN